MDKSLRGNHNGVWSPASWHAMNPYKPSVILWGVGKENVASDQVLHCLHAEYTFKNRIKFKLATQQPLNLKWIRPI